MKKFLLVTLVISLLIPVASFAKKTIYMEGSAKTQCNKAELDCGYSRDREMGFLSVDICTCKNEFTAETIFGFDALPLLYGSVYGLKGQIVGEAIVLNDFVKVNKPTRYSADYIKEFDKNFAVKVEGLLLKAKNKEGKVTLTAFSPITISQLWKGEWVNVYTVTVNLNQQ